jgi:hypothetical protein
MTGGLHQLHAARALAEVVGVMTIYRQQAIVIGAQ